MVLKIDLRIANNKLPVGQQLVLTYTENDEAHYLITKNAVGIYSLYSVKGVNLQKLKTANTPIKFKEVYPD